MIKRDDRGLSLVEVIVVVAIIAVVGGVGIWGINAISGRPAQQCAQKLIYSLEHHRTTAMGKAEAYYVLRVDPSKKIICEEYVRNRIDEPFVRVSIDEVGSSRVKLSYELPGGGVVNMAPNDSITFRFDRGSGAFESLPCVRLIAKSGGREVKVKLVKLTGKVYLDLD